MPTGVQPGRTQQPQIGVQEVGEPWCLEVSLDPDGPRLFP